ncbi:hypothetical protein N0V93_002226 [Gnomoniopsis smithogilvyi]|uniref:Uncharacterized protein n=1 Tax=Gnomoniopsis smithogilvyi TaxID=1191159 RepID=A0A9W8YYC4_9PEZI|nr:hypothetical protein N0V93_002226 [Gnomoniopsis smithogilvyi]
MAGTELSKPTTNVKLEFSLLSLKEYGKGYNLHLEYSTAPPEEDPEKERTRTRKLVSEHHYNMAESKSDRSKYCGKFFEDRILINVKSVGITSLVQHPQQKQCFVYVKSEENGEKLIELLRLPPNKTSLEEDGKRYKVRIHTEVKYSELKSSIGGPERQAKRTKASARADQHRIIADWVSKRAKAAYTYWN